MDFVWYGADDPETYGWAYWIECWYNMIYLEYYGLWDYGTSEKPKRSAVLGQTSGQAGFGPMSYCSTSKIAGVVEMAPVNSG